MNTGSKVKAGPIAETVTSSAAGGAALGAVAALVGVGGGIAVPIVGTVIGAIVGASVGAGFTFLRRKLTSGDDAQDVTANDAAPRQAGENGGSTSAAKHAR